MYCPFFKLFEIYLVTLLQSLHVQNIVWCKRDGGVIFSLIYILYPGHFLQHDIHNCLLAGQINGNKNSRKPAIMVRAKDL